jgi:hypothetical protein
MAKTRVHVTAYAGVEYGYAETETDAGRVSGRWEVEGGKGRGWSEVDPGGTGLTEQEAEAALDAALEEYYGKGD